MMMSRETIDGMVRDACEVEKKIDPEGPVGYLIRDLCCHVKALACEVERLRELWLEAEDGGQYGLGTS